ncbi:hypothetical protein Y1Q_0022704 [Alligator mississippiensis]|uniref:Uncharacterized protein n=1 Tax=Alligator mississippiensis TaxID=8496 RepID=A0A151MY89_ALLMI|nr:hypothetical protein Y1Q_0022704 [Alligator mississippiensis]
MVVLLCTFTYSLWEAITSFGFLILKIQCSSPIKSQQSAAAVTIKASPSQQLCISHLSRGWPASTSMLVPGLGFIAFRRNLFISFLKSVHKVIMPGYYTPIKRRL